MFPKFDPSENILVDDHLQIFYLAIEGLRAGEHEDVVSRLFPHTLKGATSSWYFLYLQTQSQTGIHLKEYLEVSTQSKKLMQR